MPLWKRMRDPDADIPYAWYWKGKSLRADHALGGRLHRIQIHPQYLDTCAYAPSLGDNYPDTQLEMDSCDRCQLSPDNRRGSHRWARQPYYDCYRYSCNGSTQAGYCLDRVYRGHSHANHQLPEPRTSHIPDYYHQGHHRCMSSSCPYVGDSPPINHAPIIYPMSVSPSSGIPYSCPPVPRQSDIPLGRYQEHGPLPSRSNQTGMRQGTPMATGTCSDPRVEPHHQISTSFKARSSHERMTESDTYIGPPSDAGSNEMDNRSYHRRRPRAKYPNYGRRRQGSRQCR